MFGLTRKQLVHALMAVGTGLGVFLWQATGITHNPWVAAGCFGGLALLGALGVGAANRMPSGGSIPDEQSSTSAAARAAGLEPKD